MDGNENREQITNIHTPKYQLLHLPLPLLILRKSFHQVWLDNQNFSFSLVTSPAGKDIRYSQPHPSLYIKHVGSDLSLIGTMAVVPAEGWNDRIAFNINSLHIKLNNFASLPSPLGFEQIGCDEMKNVGNYRGQQAGPGNTRKAMITPGRTNTGRSVARIWSSLS